MANLFIERIFHRNFLAAITRFPLPFLCSLAFTILAISWHHDAKFLNDFQVGWILIILACGAFGLIGLKLLFEAKRWRQWIYLLTSVIFLGLCTFEIYDNSQYVYCAAFLIPGLFLFLYAAPFLFDCDADDNEVYRFAYNLTVAGLFAFIAALILSVGLQLIILTLNFLFNAGIDGKYQIDVFIFGGAFFAPLYAIAAIPTDFHNRDLSIIPRGLEVLFQWVIIPLVVIYMGILYAYFGKIFYQGELPKGVLTYITLIYSIVGMKAYWFASFSMNQNKLVKVYQKTFFWFLLLPLVVLFWSIYLRIDQYGLTPSRYAIVVIAVWIAINAVAGIITCRPSLKYSLSLLATMIILSSFGPWSAYNLSVYSQLRRLDQVLTNVGLIQDGKIHPAKKVLSLENRKEISSLLSALDSYGIPYSLKDKLSPEGALYKKPARDWSVDSVLKELNIEKAYPFQNKELFSFSYDEQQSKLLSIGGAKYQGQAYFYQPYGGSDKDKSKTYKFDDKDEITFTVDWDKQVLLVALNSGASLKIDLTKIAQDINSKKNGADEQFVYDYKIGSHSLRMVLLTMGGEGKNIPTIKNIGFNFYLK